MNEAKQVSISADLVDYLRRQRGMNLKQIGELVDLSESFVSRVARRQRSFTVEHLEKFERALGQPLPVLLLEALWENRIPNAQREMFAQGLELLRNSTALLAALDEGDDLEGAAETQSA